METTDEGIYSQQKDEHMYIEEAQKQRKEKLAMTDKQREETFTERKASQWV